MNRGLKELLAAGSAVPFVDYCQAALYGEGGYYRADRPRVGTAGADFYTNLSVRSVFAPLVLESFRALDPDAVPGNLTFVEIGVEAGQSLFEPDDHPFAAYRTVPFGDDPRPEGDCWVFANEWLDAQPFARLVYRAGAWCEVLVEPGGGGLSRG